MKYGASDCLGYLMTCLENSTRYVGGDSESRFRMALQWFCYLCGDLQKLSVLRQAGMELQQWVDGRQVCTPLLGAAIQGHNTETVRLAELFLHLGCTTPSKHTTMRFLASTGGIFGCTLGKKRGSWSSSTSAWRAISVTFLKACVPSAVATGGYFCF